MSKPFYITTPIFYVNGAPHIGHAYTMVAADVIARWHRLNGREVFFLTGTDEHGQKVEKAALDAGLTPQDFADQVSATFRQTAENFNISHDVFIRTTEERHKRAATSLWQRLSDNGHIYLGTYSGWYSIRDEQFWDDGELMVDENGDKIAPTGAKVEYVSEPSYFFRLSNFRDRLVALIERECFIGPKERRNEMLGFLKAELNDISISRTSFRWGIPVPGDDKHVMYVWVDALANYLTAVGYPDQTAELWKFWPANLHLVGKDILRFHTVIWPALLMAADLPLPERVFAHGWWTVNGEKMSKSVGNVVDPNALAERFGVDPVRYFLLREARFGADGDFRSPALLRRLNGDLANDLGNLAQRTLSFVARFAGGVHICPGEPTTSDLILCQQCDALLPLMGQAIEKQEFHEALSAVWQVVSACNAYIVREEPWKLKGINDTRMRDILGVLLGNIRVLATLLLPFMPNAMNQLLDQLGVPLGLRNIAGLGIGVAPGTVLPTPTPIFRKVVDTI